MEGLVISIILDMIFWARFIYIKTQFYKTKGIAYGNDNHYFSEFLIRDDKGYNYVGWVSMNIFSPLHTRGEVYTIYVSKINPKNAVMGNEPTIYLVLSIVFFVFVIFYLKKSRIAIAVLLFLLHKYNMVFIRIRISIRQC